MSDHAPEEERQFYIYECENTDCRFRFPLHQQPDGKPGPATMPCPPCKSSARQVTTFGTADAAAPSIASTVSKDRPHVEVLLDNVRSIFNVGSIFRTADGANIQHLHLCGITPTPAHPKLAKTALGAEKAIAWTYHKNGLDAVRKMKEEGQQIWGLEDVADSQSLYKNPHHHADPASSIVIVLGNEISGVDPEILQQCDNIYHLPMAGTKRSLNIAVAFGIAIYHLQFGPSH